MTPTPDKQTLRYIETMLRGDTDRIQVADYIAEHVIPALATAPPSQADTLAEALERIATKLEQSPLNQEPEAQLRYIRAALANYREEKADEA